jgi:hypothetical protein
MHHVLRSQGKRCKFSPSEPKLNKVISRRILKTHWLTTLANIEYVRMKLTPDSRVPYYGNVARAVELCFSPSTEVSPAQLSKSFTVIGFASECSASNET